MLDDLIRNPFRGYTLKFCKFIYTCKKVNQLFLKGQPLGKKSKVVWSESRTSIFNLPNFRPVILKIW